MFERMVFLRSPLVEVLLMPADQLRNRTVGSKMTESEYDQVVAVAEREGLTLGEWCREVLLAYANSSDLKKPSATEQILLAEFVALRMILLNALCKLGQKVELSEHDLKVLTERADQERFSRAQERFAEAVAGRQS
jgi:hypothetical protein